MNKQFKTDAQDFLNSVQVLREVQTPESENHMYDGEILNASSNSR